MAITFDQSKLNTKSRIGIVEEIEDISRRFAVKNNIQIHYSGLPYIRTAITDRISRLAAHPIRSAPKYAPN